MKVMERNYQEAIHCPFCAKQISLKRNRQQICQHTMFVSSDSGVAFEDHNFSIGALYDENQFWADSLRESIEPKIVMIKTYSPAPKYFGAYYLFKR
ncbi:MAG: hypothetical protein OCC45_03610 [Desulfotalea sp.]